MHVHLDVLGICICVTVNILALIAGNKLLLENINNNLT